MRQLENKVLDNVNRVYAGPGGLAVWGDGLGRLVAELEGSNPAWDSFDNDSVGMTRLKQESPCVPSVSTRVPSRLPATYLHPRVRHGTIRRHWNDGKYLLTYILTPMSRVLLEKLTGSAASQEIPRIFGTRRFITLLTSARHLSLSWANSIQSPQTPPISWRSILILSSHLRLGLPSP